MEISEKLKEARKKNGLSQEQVAEKIMVSRVTVSHWETVDENAEEYIMVCEL